MADPDPTLANLSNITYRSRIAYLFYWIQLNAIDVFLLRQIGKLEIPSGNQTWQ